MQEARSQGDSSARRAQHLSEKGLGFRVPTLGISPFAKKRVHLSCRDGSGLDTQIDSMELGVAES
jgi:hypothetical protein